MQLIKNGWFKAILIIVFLLSLGLALLPVAFNAVWYTLWGFGFNIITMIYVSTVSVTVPLILAFLKHGFFLISTFTSRRSLGATKTLFTLGLFTLPISAFVNLLIGGINLLVQRGAGTGTVFPQTFWDSEMPQHPLR